MMQHSLTFHLIFPGLHVAAPLSLFGSIWSHYRGCLYDSFFVHELDSLVVKIKKHKCGHLPALILAVG